MINLTLIKQHPCIQLAHLYEHLFMRQVNKFFYDHSLYKHLDYSARGTTYEQGGIIVIDIDLYTDEAARLATNIPMLQVEFGENFSHVTTELIRISAEESHQVYISSKPALLSQLEKLDAQKWSTIDDIDVIDTKTIRRKSDPIYITNKPQQKPTHLKIDFQIRSFTNSPTNNNAHLPLFNITSRILALTLENQLAAQHGFYGDTLNGKVNKSPRVTHKLLIDRRHARNIQFNSLVSSVHSTLEYAITNETLNRLADILKNTNYSHGEPTVPDFDRLITETGIMIGAKGWRQNVTQENIIQVLAQTSVTLKFGLQQATFLINVKDR